MNETKYPRIGERVHWYRLKNGLPVCIVPRKGFARKYALFATRYGLSSIMPISWPMMPCSLATLSSVK